MMPLQRVPGGHADGSSGHSKKPPSGLKQAPDWQLASRGQATPQPPQAARSLLVSTQAPSQQEPTLPPLRMHWVSTATPAQLSTGQKPLLQKLPTGQALPQT